jgi:rubredoxin
MAFAAAPSMGMSTEQMSRQTLAARPAFMGSSFAKAVRAPVMSRSSRGLSVRADAKVQPTERSGEVDQGSVRSGITGNEAPRGHMTTNAPLKQGQGTPVADRIAYLCQSCGYVYDGETPWEDVADDYQCPVCTAPKENFLVQNATVGEIDSVKPEDS